MLNSWIQTKSRLRFQITEANRQCFYSIPGAFTGVCTKEMCAFRDWSIQIQSARSKRCRNQCGRSVRKQSVQGCKQRQFSACSVILPGSDQGVWGNLGEFRWSERIHRIKESRIRSRQRSEYSGSSGSAITQESSLTTTLWRKKQRK